MSLSGNLRTMALPDILQWIAIGRKTGTLRIERRSIQKRILFRQGSLVSSWSNDPRESLGQFLVRERLIGEEQLFRSLLRQEAERRLLGSLLVEEGLLSEDDLRRVMTTKAEETIYELFLWPEGAFDFDENSLPDELPFPIDLDVQTAIFEGARRVDEWLRIREVIPTPKATFAVVDAGASLSDPAEVVAFELAAQGKPVAEIALHMRRSDFDATFLLFSLHERGLLRVANPGEVTQPLETVEAIQTRLGEGYQRMQEKRYDLAIKAYEEVLALDRLNQHAKKGLIAVVEARDRERALLRIPLDGVPRLAMDFATLTKEKLDPQEGFVVSRVNGEWDIRSILKLVPIPEEDALIIFVRLLDRKVIALD